MQYFIGDFDGKTFTPDKDAQGNVPTKWLDYGKDNYALVSWSDAPGGRRTAIGWMSNWQYAAEVPTRQFRSANTLPRDISLFQAPDGQIYAANAPAPEVDALRAKTFLSKGKVTLGKRPATFNLPKENDGICEINLDILATEGSKVELTLANAQGEKAVIIYDAQADTISFDRTQSGTTDFSQDFPAITTAPLFGDGRSVSLRIFIDRASVELFADSGRSVMTNLLFPESPYSALTAKTLSGKAEIRNLKIHPLTPQN